MDAGFELLVLITGLTLMAHCTDGQTTPDDYQCPADTPLACFLVPDETLPSAPEHVANFCRKWNTTKWCFENRNCMGSDLDVSLLWHANLRISGTLHRCLTAGAVNLAQNQPTWQSSTLPESYATSSLAVDGNSDSNSNCSHTEREEHPWWAVDLGQPTNVGRVVFYNRQDGSGEGANGFIVGLSNVSTDVQSPTVGSYAVCGRHSGHADAVETVSCSPLSPAARFVIIQLNRTAALTICEVQVFESNGTGLGKGLKIRPTNVAVGWNQIAALNCTSHNESGYAAYWFNAICNFTDLRSCRNITVFDSLNITSRFSSRMNISSGDPKDLLIRPQFASDATEYFCADPSRTDVSSAQLVVVGSNLSCNISSCCTFANSSTLTIKCGIQYEGKMTAAVHCEANGMFLFNGSLAANITTTGNLSSTRISCRAYFEPNQALSSPHCANNTVVTEYVYTSSSVITGTVISSSATTSTTTRLTTTSASPATTTSAARMPAPTSISLLTISLWLLLFLD